MQQNWKDFKNRFEMLKVAKWMLHRKPKDARGNVLVDHTLWEEWQQIWLKYGEPWRHLAAHHLQVLLRSAVAGRSPDDDPVDEGIVDRLINQEVHTTAVPLISELVLRPVTFQLVLQTATSALPIADYLHRRSEGGKFVKRISEFILCVLHYNKQVSHEFALVLREENCKIAIHWGGEFAAQITSGGLRKVLQKLIRERWLEVACKLGEPGKRKDWDALIHYLAVQDVPRLGAFGVAEGIKASRLPSPMVGLVKVGQKIVREGLPLGDP